MKEYDPERENLSGLSYMDMIARFKSYEGKKKDLILAMAEKLDALKRLTKIEVKDKIIHDLQGYAAPSYVREILGSEYTDQKYASPTEKKRIALTNNGEQEPDDELPQLETRETPEQRRERIQKERQEWMRHKNYGLIGKASTKEENKKKEDFLEIDDDRTSQTTRALEEMRDQCARLNSENQRLKEEITENATVAIQDHSMFREIVKLATDKNVTKIYLDFDVNMIVTKIRATI